MPGIIEPIEGTVSQHRYRTAVATDVFLTLPRELLGRLEQELADRALCGRDNHVVYEIKQNSGTIYIMFSDYKVTFGLNIEINI